MTRHPTTVPMHCPDCGATVCLPVTRSLIARLLTGSDDIDYKPLDDHMVVCEAERILEAAE